MGGRREGDVGAPGGQARRARCWCGRRGEVVRERALGTRVAIQGALHCVGL